MTDDELRLAKERLMKLWDAYESQEKEMAAAKARINDLEEKQKDKERVIETLRELVDQKDNELRKQELKVSSLEKETADQKERLEELSNSLNMERSRYKKLFVITQELERDVEDLTKELEGRDRWFRDNLSFFEELPARMGNRLEMVNRKKPVTEKLAALGTPSEKPSPSLSPAEEEKTFEKINPRESSLKVLMELPGVDEEKAQVLYEAGYGDVDKLKGVSPFELVKLEGITPTVARKITDHVKA
ncbi:MAG: helix-hairpin-helix domain-containing protein [Thermoplasmatota archaeon]